MCGRLIGSMLSQRFQIIALLVASGLVALGGESASPPPGAEVSISAQPFLNNGVREYPTPFLAVARTPTLIPPLGAVIGLQDNLGCLAGFGGLVDAATGRVGFPADERPFSLDDPSPWATGKVDFPSYGSPDTFRVSFDDEKMVLTVNFPYPYGRKPRAAVTDPRGDLLSDDVFEILIEPRDSQGRSRGPVYRIIGNAAGVCRLDEDLPQLGQLHQAWNPPARYGVMISGGGCWGQEHVWMGAVQIPFAALGGAPADGDTWGVQCVLHYADPKVTAMLSPADSTTDTSRFARLRFDFNRRANYNFHLLDEAKLTNGVFSVASWLCNSGNDPATMTLNVRLYQGSKEIGSGSQEITAKPDDGFDFVPPLAVPTELAGPAERDTVGRVTVTDRKSNTVIYDQFIPYWRPAPGERDWLKTYFAREFTFLTGPYPSYGVFDWSLDCRSLMESIPSARYLEIAVQHDGQEILDQTNALPKTGKCEGTLSAGAMADGAKYEVAAIIRSADGQEISAKTNRFTRRVMPFETAPKPGLSDIVVPPFTPPVIGRDAVSVWDRTYHHGKGGLVESLTAAGEEILAWPVQFHGGRDAAGRRRDHAFKAWKRPGGLCPAIHRPGFGARSQRRAGFRRFLSIPSNDAAAELRDDSERFASGNSAEARARHLDRDAARLGGAAGR